MKAFSIDNEVALVDCVISLNIIPYFGAIYYNFVFFDCMSESIGNFWISVLQIFESD